MTEDDLNKIVQKKGYGFTQFKSQFTSGFKREALLNQAGGSGAVPKLERSIGSKSVRPEELTIPNSGRCIVRVKVFRKRLTDTGNDCWKYHLDACRYLGFLEDDDDATIRLEEEPHEKVGSDEEERVEITLEYPNLTFQQVIDYYASGPKNQNNTG